MESSTKNLRRLLDERGVEWRERVWGGKHSVTTFWHARGVRWHYRENRFGELRLHADGLAPEQAIAATLGRGTCHNEDGWCSECQHFLHVGFEWCPWCGRKVVDPTTNDVDGEVTDG